MNSRAVDAISTHYKGQSIIWQKTTSLDSWRRLLSCHGRHLGFDGTGNSAVQSTDLENPILEPNIKWIGLYVAEIWHDNCSCHRQWQEKTTGFEQSRVARYCSSDTIKEWWEIRQRFDSHCYCAESQWKNSENRPKIALTLWTKVDWRVFLIHSLE